MISFKDPWIILLAPFLLVLIFLLRKRLGTASIMFSSVGTAVTLSPTWKVRLRHIPFALRLLAVILFVVALAGPRSVLSESVHKTEGIDIVLAIDASFSMRAEDFMVQGRPVSRFDVIKDVVREFVERRTSDRIGLVVFGARAYTVSPLTSDYSWLLTNFDRVVLGMIDGSSTAIGSAIATSVGRLKDSLAKSRIIILLTDGENNAGKINPLEAAAVAKSFGVKLYTIGAGTRGLARMPLGKDLFGRMVYGQERVNIDEDLLQGAAQATGGKYFRATDTESLKNIYSEIDALEKTKIEEYGYMDYKELFGYVLAAALSVLCLEAVLTQTAFLKVP